MAKQTFTTGQVLTAAQMTSLQQTAMLGGAASAKTASYTLVAADAGTAISMSSASATTITVNTALFAAGDTVQITNLGAGVCTITAGTATVNSSASLALAQYESGTLDFTSTSAAIFIKGAGAAATSGGMTLISTTTLTGSTITLSSIPGTYNNLQLLVKNYKPATDNTLLRLRINSDSGVRYRGIHTDNPSNAGSTDSFTNSSIAICANSDDTVATGMSIVNIYDYSNAVSWKMLDFTSIAVDPTTVTDFKAFNGFGYFNQTAAITSLDLFPTSGNFTSGTALLYGVK